MHQKKRISSPLIFPRARLLGTADLLATVPGAAFGRLKPSAFSNNSCNSFLSAAFTVLVNFCGRTATRCCTFAIHRRDSPQDARHLIDQFDGFIQIGDGAPRISKSPRMKVSPRATCRLDDRKTSRMMSGFLILQVNQWN